MTTSLAIRLRFEEIRTLPFGSIGAAYMGIGGAFAHPIRLVVLQNFTDQSMMFSFDGIVDHLKLPEMGYIILDVTANKTREQGYYIAEGDRVYVKQELAAPSSGSVYVSAMYGSV